MVKFHYFTKQKSPKLVFALYLGQEGAKWSLYGMLVIRSPKGPHGQNMGQICDYGFITSAWWVHGALTDCLLNKTTALLCHFLLSLSPPFWWGIMFVFCLSVFYQNISRTGEHISIFFYRRCLLNKRKNWLNFGWDLIQDGQLTATIV